jgi:AraC family transcriptional regulator of arabinose operon
MHRPDPLQILTGHFHEAPGYQTLRERGTDDWLLILTLDGVGRFGYDDGNLYTRSGEIALIRPGTRHDYATAPEGERWELLWVHFHPRPAWHEWLGWPEIAPGLMHLVPHEPIRERITTRLFEMHRLATGALKRRDVFAMNALEEALLWCETQSPRAEQSPMDERVRGCVEYLCQNLAERVTLEGLAAHCNLSVSRLAHLFRAQVGLTPQQFQEQQRLLRARQLLELSGHSIGQIAAEVGFDNPFYFTLRFKRLTGLSPRDYRKQFR